jgi:hypothetical protein
VHFVEGIDAGVAEDTETTGERPTAEVMRVQLPSLAPISLLNNYIYFNNSLYKKMTKNFSSIWRYLVIKERYKMPIAVILMLIRYNEKKG